MTKELQDINSILQDKAYENSVKGIKEYFKTHLFISDPIPMTIDDLKSLKDKLNN